MMGLTKSLAAVALLGAALGLPATAHAGKLSKVRGEVRSGSKSSSRSSSSRSSSSSSRSSSRSSSSSSRSSSSRSRSSDSSSSYGYGYSGGHSSGSSCCAGNSTLKAPIPPTVPRYNRFPYQHGTKGYVQRVPLKDKDEVGRLWSTQASAEGGYLGDSVWKMGFGLDLNFWRVGLGSDLDWLVEGRMKDAMYLGSTNARFTLIMQPRLRVRFGGGAQYMVDGRTPGEGVREYASGPNFTTDASVYPFWPVTLSGRFDYGTLYKTPSVLARGTVGAVIEGVELYGGYEFRLIGAVPMQGPVLGLRIWF